MMMVEVTVGAIRLESMAARLDRVKTRGMRRPPTDRFDHPLLDSDIEWRRVGLG
jgi:hypothetical protein